MKRNERLDKFADYLDKNELTREDMLATIVASMRSSEILELDTEIAVQLDVYKINIKYDRAI